MANNTFIDVPTDIAEPIVLKRFLIELIEKIDVAFGLRGNTEGFTTIDQSSQVAQDLVDGQIFTNLKFYAQEFTISKDLTLITKKYLNDNATKNDKQAAIIDGSYTKVTPGAIYVQADSVGMDNGIDTLNTKVNEILVALRSADIIEV